MNHLRTTRAPRPLRTLSVALVASTGACNLIVNTSVPDDAAGGRPAQAGSSGASHVGGRGSGGDAASAGGSITGEAGASGDANSAGGALAAGGANDSAGTPPIPNLAGGLGSGGSGGSGGLLGKGGTLGGGGTLDQGGTFGGGGTLNQGGTLAGGSAAGGALSGGAPSATGGGQACSNVPAAVTGPVFSSLSKDVKNGAFVGTDGGAVISPSVFKDESCVCVSGNVPDNAYAYVTFPKGTTFSELRFDITGNTDHLNVYLKQGSNGELAKYCYHLGSLDNPDRVQTFSLTAADFEEGECSGDPTRKLKISRFPIDLLQFQIGAPTPNGFGYCILDWEITP